MNSPGRLIVFEGPDEVGKTTLANATTTALRARGEDVVPLAFPGHEAGTLGALVYRLHHEPSEFDVKAIAPASLQLLHVAAHIDTIDRKILPALALGKTVVLDRFWWSTLVYGLVAGADRRLLEQMISLEHTFWGQQVPDVVFLVQRNKPFRPVADLLIWERVALEYTALARRENRRHRVVELPNEDSLPAVVQRVWDVITPWSKPRTGSSKATDVGPNHDVSDLPLFEVHVRLTPAKTTVVYDTYWRFAAERQAIFFRRQNGSTPPWTHDPILAQYKFTNAYRASDRTSQYLIKNVAYSGDQSPEEILFRVLLFKTFNRIETWELLTAELGKVQYADYKFSDYDRVLTHAMSQGQTIYSAAYIMTSGRSAYGSQRKHRNHLRLIEEMMREDLAQRIPGAKSMCQVYETLLSYPTIGPFLAYQYATDINYTGLTRFSEMEFVVPGPGARDGLRKCFADFGGLTESDLIRLVTERQNVEFERLGILFPSLWGRPLQLIDCQNLFCEVDKYARVKHPEVAGLSGRTRIKQRYEPTIKPLGFWYPPSWGLNERIAKGVPDVPRL
jgi:thymidylate kinase